LLGELGRDGEAPLALAASLHLRGQPEVRSSNEAFEAFRRSKLEALALEDWLFEASKS
jgi:predicted NodU family carbamoyl transferase